jgi:DNA-binding NarL/FixJ family response regulator
MTPLQLGPRKRQVAELLCSEGCQDREIARRLHISPCTVKAHVRHMCLQIRLDRRFSKRVQLALWLLDNEEVWR